MTKKSEGINVFQKCLTVLVILCTAGGVLTKVPVMLFLVSVANKTSDWFSANANKS